MPDAARKDNQSESMQIFVNLKENGSRWSRLFDLLPNGRKIALRPKHKRNGRIFLPFFKDQGGATLGVDTSN